MRYHYFKNNNKRVSYGHTYKCSHDVYNECTLFEIGEKGMAVIQQRFDILSKNTWWGSIDLDITADIYLNPKFREYFNKVARTPINGIYPTVTVRQIMWALRMKPLKKEIWETVFDRGRV